MTNIIPLFVSIPHAGEKIPDFCDWLQGHPEEIIMCDVDRYVDHLYEPALKKLNIPLVKTEWHRYAADMNRVPEDVDEGSVEGNENPKGSFERGFHWQITTLRNQLMNKPMTKSMHNKLVKMIYEPFHEDIKTQYESFHKKGIKVIYHIDAHSMPSVGTSEHRDPGESRADIVISDCKGKSAKKEFVDLAIAAYVRAGFKVRYNWPYLGGRLSEQYGSPVKGRNVVQVELNRALYMNEQTKKISSDHTEIQDKIALALDYIKSGISFL